MALFRWRSASGAATTRPPASVPDGLRVYAIGDVHARFDLLQDLLGRIERDGQARPAAHVHIVMLGDIIDRGPQSREIIDFFLHRRPDFASFHFVMGNHEEMLLRLIDDPEPGALLQFLRFGGRETFESYGAPQKMLDLADRYAPEALLHYVPEEHRSFLRRMHDGLQYGQYFFTHAGIRPGVPLDEQERQDLRWIRGPFLDSDEEHGVIVVHGHTVREAPEVRHNRIGIDTGAYATGVLTALGLQGIERWLLHTAGLPGR